MILKKLIYCLILIVIYTKGYHLLMVIPSDVLYIDLMEKSNYEKTTEKLFKLNYENKIGNAINACVTGALVLCVWNFFSKNC